MPWLEAELSLIETLVAHPTISGSSTRGIVAELAERLDDAASAIWVQEEPVTETQNLIVWLGPRSCTPSRRGLVLAAHLDVVPANEGGWLHDPFRADRGPDRISGRGTADMKSFIALAVVSALKAVDRLKHPLVLIFTRDEEIGTRGARQLVLAPPFEQALPRAAIIGEPTHLQAVSMHKGHARFRLELFGKAAHSGYPQLGESAIEHASRALLALDGLRQDLAGERTPTSRFFPDVPFVPLNVGTIHGGYAVNVVPERCVLEFGVRALPGTDTETLFARIGRRLAEAVPHGRYDLALLDESPPLEPAPDASLHARLCAHLGTAQLAHPSASAVNYATDAGWLRTLDLDCVVWGPGAIEVAHRPNEYVEFAQLARARQTLDELIDSHCIAE